MKIDKMKFAVTLIILILVIGLYNNVVKATDNFEFGVLDKSNYSKEYKKWLELSEEERKNYIMPQMFTTNLKLEENQSEACASSLPKQYDLRDYIDINVENQQDIGSCWAIAASTMFEVTEAKLNKKDNTNQYSSRHMEYLCSTSFTDDTGNLALFNRDAGNGGNVYLAFAYYSSGRGPILESDMPFENNKNRISISKVLNKNVQAQIKDCTMYAQIYKTYDSNNNVTYSNGDSNIYSSSTIDSFRNSLKEQIINYGPITTYNFSPETDDDIKNNNYYADNGKYVTYFCNNSSLKANHQICIIGWDDTFSKSNFTGKAKPANDGAWLVLNSWGRSFGDDGVYYVSYDDYFIDLDLNGIQGVSKVDYDNIYQYDELGMNNRIFAYEKETNNTYETLYAKNVFKKKTKDIEKITKIGLYIYENNTNVTVYLNDTNNVIASAINLSKGYHVLPTNICINEDFKIIVKYNSKSGALVPVEVATRESNDFWSSASANLGEGFVSFDGVNWMELTQIETFEEANLCIKAFTTNITEETPAYISNSKLKVVEDVDMKMLTGVDENSTISNLISTENFLSSYTAKAYKNGVEISTGNATTGTIIKVYSGSTLVDELTLVIYGDTTGDGNIAALDALTIVKNKLNVEKFKNAYFEQAGRTTIGTRNAKLQPSAVDALAVVKNKLNIEKIVQ